MVDLLDKGKDGGIIARLALPSKIPGKVTIFFYTVQEDAMTIFDLRAG